MCLLLYGCVARLHEQVRWLCSSTRHFFSKLTRGCQNHICAPYGTVCVKPPCWNCRWITMWYWMYRSLSTELVVCIYGTLYMLSSDQLEAQVSAIHLFLSLSLFLSLPPSLPLSLPLSLSLSLALALALPPSPFLPPPLSFSYMLYIACVRLYMV